MAPTSFLIHPRCQAFQNRATAQGETAASPAAGLTVEMRFTDDLALGLARPDARCSGCLWAFWLDPASLTVVGNESVCIGPRGRYASRILTESAVGSRSMESRKPPPESTAPTPRAPTSSAFWATWFIKVSLWTLRARRHRGELKRLRAARVSVAVLAPRAWLNHDRVGNALGENTASVVERGRTTRDPGSPTLDRRLSASEPASHVRLHYRLKDDDAAVILPRIPRRVSARSDVARHARRPYPWWPGPLPWSEGRGAVAIRARFAAGTFMEGGGRSSVVATRWWNEHSAIRFRVPPAVRC